MPPTPVLWTIDGVVQTGRDGVPLRKFLRMARNISTEIEGFEIDYLFCAYPNLSWQDFRDRMPTMSDGAWTRFKNLLGSKRWWEYRSTNGPLSLNPPTGRQPVSKRDQIQFRRLPQGQREEALARNISWPLHETKDGQWFTCQREPKNRPGPPSYGGSELYEGRLFPAPPRQTRSERIKNIVEKEEAKDGEGKDAQGNVTGWKNGAQHRRSRKRNLVESEGSTAGVEDRMKPKSKHRKRAKTMHQDTPSSHTNTRNSSLPGANTDLQDTRGLSIGLGQHGLGNNASGMHRYLDHQLRRPMHSSPDSPSLGAGDLTTPPDGDDTNNACQWPQDSLLQDSYGVGWGQTSLSASHGEGPLGQVLWHQPTHVDGRRGPSNSGCDDILDLPSPLTLGSVRCDDRSLIQQMQHPMPEERDEVSSSDSSSETLEADYDERFVNAQPLSGDQDLHGAESRRSHLEDDAADHHHTVSEEPVYAWIYPAMPQFMEDDSLPQSNTSVPWNPDRLDEL